MAALLLLAGCSSVPYLERPASGVPIVLPGPGAETVTLADIRRPGTQRWADIAGNAYSAAFHANYSYADAEVQFTYRKRGPVFSGWLSARGLKPNFAYQVKLVGDRADRRSFEAVGYLGRWLIGRGKRTNFTDKQYRKRRNKPDVKIESYILFDYFVTDAAGRATKSLVLDSSFHVIWSKELNRRRRGPRRRDSRLFTHTVQPGGKAYWWKSPARPATVRLWLEREWVNPRPPKGRVRLAPGAYRAAIQLTEESFHLKGKRKRGWARVLQAPVSFEIVRERPAGR